MVFYWPDPAAHPDLVPCSSCGGSGRVPIVTWIGQKIALWQFKRRYG